MHKEAGEEKKEEIVVEEEKKEEVVVEEKKEEIVVEEKKEEIVVEEEKKEEVVVVVVEEKKEEIVVEEKKEEIVVEEEKKEEVIVEEKKEDIIVEEKEEVVVEEKKEEVVVEEKKEEVVVEDKKEEIVIEEEKKEEVVVEEKKEEIVVEEEKKEEEIVEIETKPPQPMTTEQLQNAQKSAMLAAAAATVPSDEIRIKPEVLSKFQGGQKRGNFDAGPIPQLTINDNAKVLTCPISPSVTEAEFHGIMSQGGMIEKIEIVCTTKKNTPVARTTFINEAEAQQALKRLHGFKIGAFSLVLRYDRLNREWAPYGLKRRSEDDGFFHPAVSRPRQQYHNNGPNMNMPPPQYGMPPRRKVKKQLK
eukprot:TRINITY_DN212_c0_g2_i2.p1 TRINITY_DN212_c0_g2~~TRINITY_DN212_c0_g2_i2.p1  ORF type:complete len:360 (+),score=225.08 TRINITY_DN212_c0_g2_i2:860-1939(+)